MATEVHRRQVVMTIKFADAENILWYQNLGIISYGSRL